MDEKRKFERFDINVPAKVEILTQAGEKKEYIFETSNLSAQGAYLKAVKPLREGSQMKIEILLNFEKLKCLSNPDGSLVIITTGRVLRSGRKGMAIHFNRSYDIKTRSDFIKENNA